MSHSPKIHASALVHPEAKIGKNCEIGPFCIVGPNVVLGDNNRLLSHVVVEHHTTIGDDNIIHPFAVLGAQPQDLKYRGENTKLLIGNHNTIRESVTINIGTQGGGGITKVGNHNLLMAYSHLGHDTIVGDRTVIANGCQIAGHVEIQDWAILGGLCAVAQFIRIGAHSYVGGCSGIDRDVAPFIVGKGTRTSFEVAGLNLVGLKRRGFTDQNIACLQEISQIFFKSKQLEKEAALKKIEETFTNEPLAKQFVDFARLSQKGIYR